MDRFANRKTRGLPLAANNARRSDRMGRHCHARRRRLPRPRAMAVLAPDAVEANLAEVGRRRSTHPAQRTLDRAQMLPCRRRGQVVAARGKKRRHARAWSRSPRRWPGFAVRGIDSNAVRTRTERETVAAQLRLLSSV